MQSGTQTVSIGSDGNWTTNDGAAAGQMPVPPPAAGIENLPPPAKQTPSFHTRFLAGKSDTVEAEKELQKLRWVLSKHPVDVPYPDLTSCCQTLLGVVLQHKLGNITAGTLDFMKSKLDQSFFSVVILLTSI